MLKQDGELTDYLQHAVQAITGKPSPISWPRKSSLLDLGWMAYDDPRYQGGWSFIGGKNLNPRFVGKSIGRKPKPEQPQQKKPGD